MQGDVSPQEHGPYAFDGTYIVRFEQQAPEAPDTDFTRQTAFVAHAGRTKLFEAAARAGQTTAKLTGRRRVTVDFGDFPYAIRFTPVRPRRSSP